MSAFSKTSLKLVFPFDLPIKPAVVLKFKSYNTMQYESEQCQILDYSF